MAAAPPADAATSVLLDVWFVQQLVFAQPHKLFQYVALFEEEWNANAPAATNLATVAAQLATVFPVMGGAVEYMPDAGTLVEYINGVRQQPSLLAGQLPLPEGPMREGRQRSVLLVIKMYLLKDLLDKFASVSQLEHLARGLPEAPLDDLVGLVNWLQQLMMQTAQNPAFLMQWQQAMQGMASIEQREAYMRGMLLDVPDQSAGLFKLAAVVMMLPEAELMQTQRVLAHAQPHEVHLLCLLLRKPFDTTMDIFDCVWNKSRTRSAAASLPLGAPMPYFAPFQEDIQLLEAAMHEAGAAAPPGFLDQHMQDVGATAEAATAASGPALQSANADAIAAAAAATAAAQVQADAQAAAAAADVAMGAASMGQLRIVRQPPKMTTKMKNLEPIPAVMLEGFPEGESEKGLIVRVTLVQYGTNIKADALQGSQIQQIGSGRIVNFKKLKVQQTCNQLDCSHFVLRFALERVQDRTPNSPAIPLGVEVVSHPFKVFSHTSQLSRGNIEATLPQALAVVPSAGPVAGGTEVAVLGKDFASSAGFVILFGQIKLRPSRVDAGWAIFVTPPCTAPPGTPVPVGVSLDGGATVGATAQYTLL